MKLLLACFKILILLIFLSSCSEEPVKPEPDLIYTVDPDVPGKIQYTITNINDVDAFRVYFEDGSSFYHPFGFAKPFGKDYYSFDHTYYSNETYSITLVVYSSKNIGGKLPGQLGGVGRRITKKINITNAQPLISAGLEFVPADPLYSSFTFTGKKKSMSSSNNSIYISAWNYDNFRRTNSITIEIPSNATDGSTYVINSQNSTVSNASIIGQFRDNSNTERQFIISDSGPAGSYGTINITSITPTTVKGTFSGRTPLSTSQFVNINNGIINIRD